MKKLLILLFIPFLCSSQTLDRFARFQEADPYIAEGAVAYFNAKNLGLADGASVTSFTDPVNGYDLSQHGGAPTFDNTLGYDQVIHDGVDDGLDMALNHADLNFDPTTDSFCIILHLGDVDIDNFLSYIIHKGSTGTSAQFWIRTASSGNNINFRAGGDSENYAQRSNINTNDEAFIVIRRDAGNIDYYLDDVLLGSETAAAAGTETETWAIGCRSGSAGNSAQTMSWRKWVFFDFAPSLAWLTERYNNRNSE